MAEFTWIASFPKSGSTWLRFIVANLLFDIGDKPEKVAEVVPSMHDWTGPLKHPWQGAYVVKTHLPYDSLPPRMHSRSAIYVMRNPLDVVDSAINYLAPDDENGRRFLVHQFSSAGSVEPWCTQLGYGSWEDHVQSWTREDLGIPCLVLRYEDLKRDPHANIARIADFLGAEADDTTIEKVMERTTFESMKRAEEAEIASGKSGAFADEHKFNKEGFRFMRRGAVGGYRDTLSDDDVARLTKRFREQMERFEYTA